MMKLVIVCLMAVAIPHVIGQSTSPSNDTSIDSVDDIYSLSDEDFQVWISGRTPKAWETSTRRTSTTSQSATQANRPVDQFESFDQSTTPRQEPAITQIPPLATSPKPDDNIRTEGYTYPRPSKLHDWLHSHMLQSDQINNQLMSSVSTLSYPPRYVGSVPDCIPASDAFGFRPAAVSFHTSATIHRFHDNTAQQVPFPGSSHQGDAFLSQSHQKPQQQQQPQPGQLQQPQQPKPTQPTPVQHHGQRITEFHGNPLFFRPPVTYVPAVVGAPPLVFRYY